jgi:hypothetical protein
MNAFIAPRAPSRPQLFLGPAMADGPLCLPLDLVLDGRKTTAWFVATISSSVVLGEGVIPPRPITVQELIGARVECGGRRLGVADDALYVLMKQKGVELDWRFSSPPELSTWGWFSLFTAPPLVTVEGDTFRLRKRGEEKRFHSGAVAIHHPQRTPEFSA